MDERTPPVKEQILDAALRLMEVRGYHRMVLGDVLRESGTGKGNFYHHFESKEVLGYAILDRVVREFTTRTLDPIFGDPARPPLEQVYAFLDALVSTQRARKCVGGCPIGNLAAELADSHEGFRERLTAVFDQWRVCLAQTLARARADGTLCPDAEPDRLACFLVAAIEGAILLAKVQKDIVVFEDCVRELKDHLALQAAPRCGVHVAALPAIEVVP